MLHCDFTDQLHLTESDITNDIETEEGASEIPTLVELVSGICY